MRLIDADDLKKSLKDNDWISDDPLIVEGGGLEELIDNASTIPLPILNEQIAWEQGYEAGLAQGKQDRPKGEWLFKHNSSDIWCSVCDENFDEIPQAFNFCPNCGADMRGGAK